MIYIGIDISINSTALTIYKENKYYFYNYTKVKKNNKWIKQTSDIINYRFLDYTSNSNSNFSNNLLNKIIFNDKYSDLIIDDINSFDDSKIIGIEGYNYGLKTTDSIIDISELSSIIKLKILTKVKKLNNVHIIPPKTIKINTSNLIYKKENNKISRNNNGIAGGNFDKHDMMNAFMDSNIDNKLKQYLKLNIEKILSMKNIPKPFDDIIDSLFIMEIINKNINI
jgi:hypothetical protein